MTELVRHAHLDLLIVDRQFLTKPPHPDQSCYLKQGLVWQMSPALLSCSSHVLACGPELPRDGIDPSWNAHADFVSVVTPAVAPRRSVMLPS